MNFLFNLSGETGPLLILDAGLGRYWRGTEEDGRDYARACDVLQSNESACGGKIAVGSGIGLVWEMGGAGTAVTYRVGDNEIRLVRNWPDTYTPDEFQHLAIDTPHARWEIGVIEVRSDCLALLWAAESGELIPEYINGDWKEIDETCVGSACFVVKAGSGHYHCWHEEVQVGQATARRLLLVRQPVS